MTFPTRVVFLIGFALLVASGFLRGHAQAAETDDAIANCLQSERTTSKEGTMAWWNRRTPEQQKTILSLPCEERYIPMVCVFLFDPDFVGCTNKGVAEKRATAACQAKGYDLMSQELADCKTEFKKTFKAPLPGASS